MPLVRVAAAWVQTWAYSSSTLGVTHTLVADGTSGTVELMHKTADQCLIYCDGGFKNVAVARTRITQGSRNFDQHDDGSMFLFIIFSRRRDHGAAERF